MFMMLLASTGPFGPSGAGCAALVVLFVSPFLLVGFALWSFLTAEPMPLRRAMAMAFGAVLLAVYALPVGLPDRSGFMLVWWVFSLLSVLLAPIVFVLELSKHGLIPRPQFGGRRKRRRRREPRMAEGRVRADYRQQDEERAE